MSGLVLNTPIACIDVELVPAFSKVRIVFGDLSVHLDHEEANTLHNLLTRALVALETEGTA